MLSASSRTARFACLRLLASALILISSSVPRLSAAQSLSHSVEAGVGALLPFDSEHREAFGLGTSLTLGYAGRLSTGDTWLFLEMGYTRSEGQELRTDPTFDHPEARYWLLPVFLGIRGNLVPSAKRTPLRLYAGTALAMAWTGWRQPFGGSYRDPTLGLTFEIRPEVGLGKGWGLWIRERASVLARVSYERQVRDVNYSGLTLQLGLSRLLSRS